MPLPEGTRYRVHTTKDGKKVRLAILNGEVIEAKNLQTGATHTPDEFARDIAVKKEEHEYHKRVRGGRR